MAERRDTADSRIFISYRRDDSIAHVNGLFPPLREHFGKERVFKDTDNIPPGKDFRKIIERELQSCSVLLTVIGRNWAAAQKPKSGIRRLDDPNDYLRVEVSTALKDEGVLVIPVLVGQAVMPAAEELPEELAQLAFLNAFELRDSRWESDVKLLIEAIEQAEVESNATPAPPPVSEPPDEPPPLPKEAPFSDQPDEDLGLLEQRRQRQIAEHLTAAQAAFAEQDYERALEACEKVIWLDTQHAEARILRRRARAALDERKIGAWLAQAGEIMGRGDVADDQLSVLSGLLDQALSLNPGHITALQHRHALLLLRKQRERQREIDEQLQALLARAQTSIEEESFDTAIACCDDAVTLVGACEEAQALRAAAVAGKAEQQRRRELKRRAQKAVDQARAQFAGAQHEAAIASLEAFGESHELVTQVLADLRGRFQAILKAREEEARAAAEQERKARVGRVEQLLTAARSALEAQQFADAHGSLHAADELARQSPCLEVLLSEIADVRAIVETVQAERANATAAALAQARGCMNRGEYESAIQFANEALTHAPDGTDALELKLQASTALEEQHERAARERRAREEKDRREAEAERVRQAAAEEKRRAEARAREAADHERKTRTASVEELLASAHSALEARQFAAADRALSDAAELAQRSPALEALVREIVELRTTFEALQERARALAVALKEAQAAFDRSDYESAIRVADEALILDPDERDAQLLKERATVALEAQRARATQEQKAREEKRRRLLEEQRERAARQLKARQEEDERRRRAGAEARAAEQARKVRTERIEELLASARSSLDTLQFATAHATLQDADALAHQSPLLEDAIDQIAAVRADVDARQAERDRAVAAALTQARASVDREDYESALREIEDALAQDSGDGEALLLKERATAARDEQRERAARDLKARQEEERRRAREEQRQQAARELKARKEEEERRQQALEAERARQAAAAEEKRRAEAMAREAKAAAEAEAAAEARAAEHAETTAQAEAAVEAQPPIETERAVAAAVTEVAPAPVPTVGVPIAVPRRYTPGTAAAALAVVLAVGGIGYWALQSSGESGASGETTQAPPSTPPAVASGGSPATGSEPATPVAAPPAPSAAAALSGPVSEPETTASAGAGSKTAPEPGAAKQLSELRDRTKRQYQAGQRAQALETAVAGLALDRDEPELRRMVTTLDADAQSAVQRAKQDATKANAAARAAAEMKLGAQKESSAVSLRKANRADEAIRSLWSAADSYSRAAERAGQVGAQLDGLAARARTQAQSGQRPQALDSALEGLKIDSGFTPLHEVIDGLWRDAQATAQRSKRQAEERGTSAKTSPEFAEALRRESDAARLGDARNMGDAVRSLWTASELFAKAAERPAISKPAEPDPPVKATEPPAVRPGPDKTPERSDVSKPPIQGPSEEEQVRKVLDDFIAAYERLDAKAVKKIYPSVNDAQLAKVFAGYRSFKMAINNRSIEVIGSAADVTCLVVTTFQPRGGGGAQTFTVPTAFRLRKSGESWIITERR